VNGLRERSQAAQRIKKGGAGHKREKNRKGDAKRETSWKRGRFLSKPRTETETVR